MKRKLINSQLSNFMTYEMYKRQCMTLAENVFEYENLPKYIDTAYLNKCLLRKGSIVFFVDEVMGLLALPYINVGTLDVYGRPQKIKAYSQNGYTKTLDSTDDFVIMYDNNGRYPLWLDILQYAERIALSTRVTDINLAQQKCPRIFKCKNGQEKTLNDLINNIDANENTIATYDTIDLDDITVILEPAPFVADKIDTHKEKDWNEFLRLIGIANMNFQKKERNIRDEVLASQGGTIASRYSRFEPRQKALEEIKEKFGYDIKVKYYDGLPSSDEKENEEAENFDEEADENDIL